MTPAHGFSPERYPWQAVLSPFTAVAPSLPLANRVRVVQSVAPGIRPDASETRAHGVAMYADNDPTVVCTAAQEFARLTSAGPEDIVSGVRTLRRVAGDPEAGGWRAGAVLGGAALRGDRRAPDLLHGARRDVAPAGKATVATAIHPGLLLIGMIVYYLNWLEDPTARNLDIRRRSSAGVRHALRGDALELPPGRIAFDRAPSQWSARAGPANSNSGQGQIGW